VLGVLPAALLAVVSGLLLAYLDTHNIFTPLVLMSVAIIFSWCVRQRYRTALFKWLRLPLVAALASWLANGPLVFMTLVLSAAGTTAARVGLAIERFPVVMFALGGMVLIGGAVSMIIQAITQKRWGRKTPLQPAPGEIDFRYRLFGLATPIFIILLAGVLGVTWSIAQKHARRGMLNQLTDTTRIAAESLGLFIETGDSLIRELAIAPEVNSGVSDSLSEFLVDALEKPPFFDSIAILNDEGGFVAGAPNEASLAVFQYFDLAQLSQQNVPQFFLVGAGDDTREGLLVFWAGVGNQPGNDQGIMCALTALDENRYAQPFMAAVDALAGQGGSVDVVGSDGTVYFHRGTDVSVEYIAAGNLSTATFFQSKSADGQALAHFYQPVEGAGWGISVTLPTLAIQEMAWELTRTNLLIASGLLVVIFFGVWIGSAPIVNEMQSITKAISAVVACDEKLKQTRKRSSKMGGYFEDALEQMLAAQKARFNRQDKLLSVSGKVAGQINLGESLHMILSAALVEDVCSARIMLSQPGLEDLPETSEKRFGKGQYTQRLSALDGAVERRAIKTGLSVLNANEIVQNLPLMGDMPELASVAIVPLKWKDVRLGVFWIALAEQAALDDEGLNYFVELARMASLAIINAKTSQDSQFSFALMATVLDALPESVIITDQKGQILLVNTKAEQLLGIKTEQLGGKTLSMLFTPGEIIKLGLEANQKLNVKEVSLRDGRSYELISNPVQVSPHQLGMVMIFRDLTQQRKADDLKTEIVTTVSHELRSPLTLILGYAKILRLTGNLNEQQDEYIGNMIDGLEEMKGLVQKLLDIGRLEGGDPLELTQFSVEQVTHKVVESLEAQARQKNIDLVVNLPEDPLIVEGDQTFVGQALKNLLENAIKFSKMGGEVRVSAWQEDEQVVFAFEDKGIGIAPLDQRNLFKKFSRINSQAGMDFQGSGLGLAIVKSIAERHGGAVRVESQLGRGSIFYFEIPRKQTP
ncbi:MAG: ATP-binding protein, partial [Brevefilum sp.]